MATHEARVWLELEQAAEVAGFHWRYIGDLCRAGEIHGSQRKRGGKWRIHRDCLDAWMAKRPCAHQEIV